MIIYAAGPIDLSTDTTWRELLHKKLTNFDVGHVIYDPSKPYMTHTNVNIPDPASKLSNIYSYIEKTNYSALMLSTMMVAHVPEKVQTIGTIIEIDTAIKAGIPVILLTNIPYGKSVYLHNRIAKDNWYTYTHIDDTLSIIVKDMISRKVTVDE